MKKTKILPFLLAASLLAGCSGNQTGLRAPKDFSGEGKEVTFKDGSLAFIKKVDEAKFDEWKLQNYSISSSAYTSSSTEKNHTKASISGKRFGESCSSSTTTYDINTKCFMTDLNSYEAEYDEGNEYDKENYSVDDITTSGETSTSDIEIIFADGATMYKCAPSSKTYVSATTTGFEFDKYAASAYAECIANYKIGVFATYLATLSGSSEDEYKKAWRESLTNAKVLPEEVEGETFKIKENDEIFTVTLDRSVSYDSNDFKGTEKRNIRAQLTLDSSNFTFNRESTIKIDASGDGLSADDKIKLNVEYYVHQAKWIDMGGSVEKPKLENYTIITSSEK